MQIQLNTDNRIQGDPSLQRHTQEVVEAALTRFKDRITRVEVHVSDENGHKTGVGDKSCTIEAKVSNLPPLSATDNADTVAAAVSGAAKKLQRVIETAVEKLNTNR